MGLCVFNVTFLTPFRKRIVKYTMNNPAYITGVFVYCIIWRYSRRKLYLDSSALYQNLKRERKF
ncbi:hypothetical protein HZS_3911 [Henneguya salminicola]|nr:hypothetical protein HZS_3911 [Henneguya salminicola]